MATNAPTLTEYAPLSSLTAPAVTSKSETAAEMGGGSSFGRMPAMPAVRFRGMVTKYADTVPMTRDEYNQLVAREPALTFAGFIRRPSPAMPLALTSQHAYVDRYETDLAPKRRKHGEVMPSERLVVRAYIDERGGKIAIGRVIGNQENEIVSSQTIRELRGELCDTRQWGAVVKPGEASGHIVMMLARALAQGADPSQALIDEGLAWLERKAELQPQ